MGDRRVESHRGEVPISPAGAVLGAPSLTRLSTDSFFGRVCLGANSFLASSMPDVSAARQSQQMLQCAVFPLPSLTPSSQLVLKRQKIRKKALEGAITSLKINK